MQRDAYACTACGHPHWSNELVVFDSVAIVAEYSDGRVETAPRTPIQSIYRCQNCGYLNDQFVLTTTDVWYPAYLRLPDSTLLLQAIRERIDLSLSAEIRLRTEAIRLYADAYRAKRNERRLSFDQFSPAMQENVESLVRIFEIQLDQTTDEEYLCNHAEFLRYQGEFNAARARIESRWFTVETYRAACILDATHRESRVVEKV